MKKPGPSFAALIAMALAGGLLWWRWPDHSTAQSKNVPVIAPQSAVPSPTVAAASGAEILRDAATRELLALIDALASRTNAREREALLSFKDNAALARFLERAANSGLTVLGQLNGLRTVRVRYDRLGALRDDLLQNAADYDSIGANSLVTVPHAPAKENRADIDQVPFRNAALGFLGVTGDHSQWGRGTTIAILDTGVAPDATFGAGRLRTLDLGFGTAPGKGGDDGHGTSVASLAAGFSPDAPGVAPSASLLSIRVTDANGTSDIFTLAQAIVAAVDAGARIVNVSLGSYATNATLSAAIAYADERGAIVVAAAGNDQAAQLAWPAADPRVVSVGAVDRVEQQVTFSNSGAQLRLTAPGYGVQTAWLDGQRVYVDGTSASAPLVSGAIAAVLSQNPGLTPQQAVQLLTRTASDAGAPGSDPAFGSGILNLATAMNTTTAGYIDTAISSHYYDEPNAQMNFVVQNRSSQTVAGLSLNLATGSTNGSGSAPAVSYRIPNLAPGEIYVVRTAVDAAALKAGATLSYATQLANPAAYADRVPANNRRSSSLSIPAK